MVLTNACFARWRFGRRHRGEAVRLK